MYTVLRIIYYNGQWVVLHMWLFSPDAEVSRCDSARVIKSSFTEVCQLFSLCNEPEHELGSQDPQTTTTKT